MNAYGWPYGEEVNVYLTSKAVCFNEREAQEDAPHGTVAE